jgi:hypothetical protein
MQASPSQENSRVRAARYGRGARRVVGEYGGVEVDEGHCPAPQSVSKRLFKSGWHG